MTKEQLLELAKSCAGELIDSEHLRRSVSLFYDNMGTAFKNADHNDLVKIRKWIPLIVENARQYHSLSHERNMLLEGSSDVVRVEVLRKKLTPHIESVRQKIFQSTKAPFASIEEAGAWIEAEGEKPIDPATEEKIQAMMALFAKYTMDCLEGKIAGGLSYNEKMLYYRNSEGKISMTSSMYHSSLKLLESAAACIERLTGIEKADAVTMILTGIVPQYKRYTVNIQTTSGMTETGEKISRRCVAVQINVNDLAFSEIKKMYSFYRESLNVTGKTGITDRQQTLFKFINDLEESPDNPSKGTQAYWTEAREVWNKLYPEYNYSAWESIRKAYIDTLEKLDRV